MESKPKADCLPWRPKEEPAITTACKRLREIEESVEVIFLQLQLVRKILQPEGGADG